jgi:hypothetical protein
MLAWQHQVIVKVGEKVRALPSNEQTMEILRRTYYRASPVAEAVSEDWEPDAGFTAEFKAKLSDFEPMMPGKVTREAFAEMVDPRR